MNVNHDVEAHLVVTIGTSENHTSCQCISRVLLIPGAGEEEGREVRVG